MQYILSLLRVPLRQMYAKQCSARIYATQNIIAIAVHVFIEFIDIYTNVIGWHNLIFSGDIS